jgi:hypothetical protein
VDIYWCVAAGEVGGGRLGRLVVEKVGKVGKVGRLGTLVGGKGEKVGGWEWEG